MGIKTKVIVNYLPQYHRIPENDKWWGDGFTDWVSVQKAKPLFDNHNQPRVPLNNYYYSLDDVEAIRWQADLARSYGVYGFGIYHYWFNSDMHLLEKPAEILLNNPDIDMNYLFLWDNCTWKRTWSNIKRANDWAPDYDSDLQQKNTDNGILAELVYGDEKDWKKHFDYLLPFFKDKRYIKIDNRPVFGFFQPRNNYDTICQMIAYWDKLSADAGFDGIICMLREDCMHTGSGYKLRYTPLSYISKLSYLKNKIRDNMARRNNNIRFHNYDKRWNEILREARRADPKTFLSGFVQYDDTPRRGKKGSVFLGSTPEKFEKYVRELAEISDAQQKEYMFITAWNEWGEGAYLEPDSKMGYAYIEALKRAIEG